MADDQLDAIGEIDLSGVSPQDFATLVRTAPREQLVELMSRPDLRAKVLDEVFTRMGAQYKGGSDIRAAIHWTILDRPGGGADVYETRIAEGQCTVGTDLREEPRVTITMDGVEFLKLVSGNDSPPMMFMSGRLTLQGDIGFAAGLSTLFDIPRPGPA